uniref:EGF-like domain-containing protein n=1 Tax=Theileria annulata TaxID=5874 RepID=A0A3B0MGJ7_THEAN
MNLILLLSLNLLSVHGFFYTLYPLVAIKSNNRVKLYCPWNQHTDANLTCRVNKDVMGYYPLPSSDNTTPLETSKFLNPSLQTPFTQDYCKSLKDGWSTKKGTDNVCKDFAFCFNVGDTKCVCSCQSGFFGNPYQACYQHCSTDDDCSSPLAVCKFAANTNEMKRCVCKDKYEGNGVMCYKNPCGDDRSSKCGGVENTVCVPTGPGDDDYKCVCPSGYYVNHEKTCVPEVTVTKSSVITLVVKNVPDGSRVEAGECLSFTLNDGSKSVFFHKNSGDSVYVKKPIKNDGKFSIFFIVTDEVTAFSSVTSSGAGLTKLYSMSSTFIGCKFGHVKVYDPQGREISGYEDLKQSKKLKLATSGGQATAPPPPGPGAQPRTGGVARVQESTLSTDLSGGIAALELSSTPVVNAVKAKPEVEVHVRELKADELAGGLSSSDVAQRQAALQSGSSSSSGVGSSVLQASSSVQTVNEL